MNHKTHQLQILAQTQGCPHTTRLRDRNGNFNALHPCSHPNAMTKRSGEIKVSQDPLRLIARTLAGVNGEPARKFLAGVLAENEVREVLTHSCSKSEPYSIELVRRAAELTHGWTGYGEQECEALYVATIILVVQELLAPNVQSERCNPSEMMFAIVCRHLHRFDDGAPTQARLLRLALGWGNEDEVDEFYVPRMQHLVQQAAFWVITRLARSTKGPQCE
jgi:hypothetical protein